VLVAYVISLSRVELLYTSCTFVGLSLIPCTEVSARLDAAYRQLVSNDVCRHGVLHDVYVVLALDRRHRSLRRLFPRDSNQRELFI